MSLREDGYFEQVSAQLESTVGAQFSDVTDSASENAESGVSPSVNALDVGIKAATAIGGLPDNVAEATILPVIGALGIKGQACLPIAKQLDPVIGIDIHLVTMPPSPVVPMPHPYAGMLLKPQDFLAVSIATYIVPKLLPPKNESETADESKIRDIKQLGINMAVSKIGATVKIGDFLPRAVASTATRSIPHVPMGTGFAIPSRPIPKNNGHAFMGSLTVLADGLPLSGGGAHLHLDCNDLGIPSVHKVTGQFLPTGIINPIPLAKPILTNPVPIPLNPVDALAKKCMGAFGRLYKKKNANAAKRLHDMVNEKIKSGKLKNMLHKTICTVTGHPVDVASGTFFTDEEDFWLDGPIPLSWERTWYSRSDYQGPLGNGWHHTYDMGIVVEDGLLTLRMSDGIPVAFPIPTEKKPSFIRAERKEARKEKEGYCIWDMDEDLYYRFTQKEYDTVHLLESVSDTNGFSIRFGYNGKGNMKEITDSAGRKLVVECDERNGRILEIKGPHPENKGEEIILASYEYDAEGNMTCQRNAVGDAMRYEYEGRLIVKETWRNGLEWHFEYDGKHIGSKCIHTWGSGGIYDHKLKYKDGVTEVLDSYDKLTIYHHQDGLVYLKIDANGGEYRWKYDSDRKLLQKTDPVGNSNLYKYDQWGNCTDFAESGGGSVSAEYFHKETLRNRPASITTADGGTWKFVYDKKGNITKRKNPEGACTIIEYNEGLLKHITDPYGKVTTLSYDEEKNLILVSDSRGNTSSYRYDGLGRCTQVTNPKGAVQTRRYDAIGRVTEVEDFDGNHIHLKYDGIDNLLEYRDDLQKVEYTYSGMWKLTHRRDSRGVVGFHYDREERLRHVINERMQYYEFDLDDVGNVIRETGFDRGIRIYQRDIAGRVTSEKLPSEIVREYEYDNASRVTRVSYVTTDEPDQTYRYGISGRLMEATRGESRVEFAYNALGLPVMEMADGETITRTYDKTGQILSLQSTLGANLEYKRNEFGELSEFLARDGSGNGEMPWKSQHSYDTLGFEIERMLPGGVMRSFAYDNIGRLVDARTRKDAQTRHMRSYRWGKADRLLATEDSRRGTTRYGYTPNGQLEYAEYGDGTEQWRKSDSVGNLYPDPDCTVRRFLKGGAMEQDGKWHCKYDKDGNLTERYIGTGRWLDGKKEHWKYRWNADGSLAKVVRPDGEEVTFEYDALGRRLSKSFGTTITRWKWNGNVPLHQWIQHRTYSWNDGNWEMEQEHSGRLLWLFDERSFVPVAMIKEGKAYSIMTDHLGTPIQAYDSEGNEVWSRMLDMDGNVLEETGNIGMIPFLFQGQYFDCEIGLAYNRFRYYSPQMGIYVSQDPIRLAGGILNLYGYVYDANHYVDIFGLDWNYVLVNSEGNIYYSGRASDSANLNDVARRHAGTKGTDGVRFGKGDTIIRITPKGTQKPTVRGIEQFGIEDSSTPLLGYESNSVRGNKINGISITNKNREDYLKSATDYLNGSTIADLIKNGETKSFEEYQHKKKNSYN